MVETAMWASSAETARARHYVAIEAKRMLAPRKEAVDMRFDRMARHPALHTHAREARVAQREATAFVDATPTIALVLSTATLTIPAPEPPDLSRLAGGDAETICAAPPLPWTRTEVHSSREGGAAVPIP
ncbi:MAG TPA: hypothetical protein VFE45_00765, partial [Coriobacteriia bacterium]|nr:hypothetical protein [Coriobacteriia bacterium]